MSSEHIIVVARNNRTGEIQLPDDMTLYGTGGEEEVLQTCRAQFNEGWTLALYRPYGDFWSGSHK